MDVKILMKIEEIQKMQRQALSELRPELIEELEVEKTELLKRLGDVHRYDQRQYELLDRLCREQQRLENICAEVRDELGQQLSLHLKRNKAAQAYQERE